jgi:hypothetical protein
MRFIADPVAKDYMLQFIVHLRFLCSTRRQLSDLVSFLDTTRTAQGKKELRWGDKDRKVISHNVTKIRGGKRQTDRELSDLISLLSLF